jgi:Tol biopolymer transport system component
MIDSFRGIGVKGWWVALLLLASAAAPAQLKIDITSGVTDPIPIAVLPFDADPRP